MVGVARGRTPGPHGGHCLRVGLAWRATLGAYGFGPCTSRRRRNPNLTTRATRPSCRGAILVTLGKPDRRRGSKRSPDNRWRSAMASSDGHTGWMPEPKERRRARGETLVARVSGNFSSCCGGARVPAPLHNALVARRLHDQLLTFPGAPLKIRDDGKNALLFHHTHGDFLLVGTGYTDIGNIFSSAGADEW